MPKTTVHFAQLNVLQGEIKLKRMANFPFHIYFEILALLTCLFFWKSSSKSTLRWFLPYLIFIVFVEIMGWYLPVFLGETNAWMFNISVPIEYIFFSFVFYSHYRKETNKKFALGFIFLFLIYVVSYSLVKGVYNFNANYLLIGSLAMIVFSVLYFYEQYIKVDTDNIWSEPMFWIVTGVFLFNAGEFSYNFISKFIIKNNLDPTIKLFRSINNKLIIVLYLLIAAGFVCLRTTKTYRRA